MGGAEIFKSWYAGQELKADKMEDQPHFYQMLEATLDTRRRKKSMVTTRERPLEGIDFASNDFLGLSASGMLRERFLVELQNNPGFLLGSGGSRLLDGDNAYIHQLEKRIASFHNAETALVLNSGYEANIAIFGTLPLPTDVIVYDEFIHASVHVGMKVTRATTKMSFKHNDLDDFRKVLTRVRDSDPVFKLGMRTVLIAIETVYSMDGDIAPVKELADIAEEIFPKGNSLFIVDEAQATGVIGPKGAGYLQATELENRMAIRLHTYGKGMSSNGAAILCNNTVRDYLINYAPGIIYTTSPSFPFLAAIKCSYDLLEDGSTAPDQAKVQALVRRFYSKLHALPIWEPAKAAGVISVPTGENFENEEFLSQIVPLIAPQNMSLAALMHFLNYVAWPHEYPVVPRGKQRVRLRFHAHNTEAQVDGLIDILDQWMSVQLLSIEKNRPINVEALIAAALEGPKALQKALEELTGEGEPDKAKDGSVIQAVPVVEQEMAAV